MHEYSLSQTIPDHLGYLIAERSLSSFGLLTWTQAFPLLSLLAWILVILFELSFVIPCLTLHHLKFFAVLAILFHLTISFYLGVGFYPQIWLVAWMFFFMTSQIDQQKNLPVSDA